MAICRAFAFAVVFVGSVASTHAQAPGDPEQPPQPPPSAPSQPRPSAPQASGDPAVPASSTVDKGVIEDANSGRSWLMPTALTPPAGTWSFSDFELLAVGVGYSPTNQLSLSLSTLLPLTKDFPLMLLASAKYQLVKVGNLRVALQGAGFYFRDSSNDTTDSVTAADLGAVGTYCIDIDCHSHVSGFVGAGFAHEAKNAVPFLVGASLAVRVAHHVKLLVEADSGFVTGEFTAAADGFLLWYGVRFTSKNIGVDLALVKPISYDGSSSDAGLVLGVPFVSFTYRAL